jgi:hypothetical protein
MSSNDRPIQPPKELCFLVGTPRSGTTWFQRLLQTHPKICGGGRESGFFNIFGPPLRAAINLSEKSKGQDGPLAYTDINSFENLFRALWNEIFAKLYRSDPDSTVHLEKSPGHVFELETIVRLFPNARFIVLMRDSRAVTSSLVHAGHGWGQYWAPKSYKEAAGLWYAYMNAVTQWRTAHPEHPCLVMRYEDAVKEPHGAVCRALEFLAVDSDARVVERMFEDYERNETRWDDPPGFNRKRGIHGWQEDMPWYGKLVTWRYTRKMMRKFGYECRPLG